MISLLFLDIVVVKHMYIMLLQQEKIQFRDFSSLYDLIVPKDNLLRKINDLIDFSFVYNELVTKYCHNNGRTAESPIKMFKYLLLKTIYDISDVDVVERSRYDMSFKYFLDMTPEDDVINPSSLTKFRKLRLKDTDLLNLLINKTVSIAIEKGVIRSKSIIVDATHTLSRSNPFSIPLAAPNKVMNKNTPHNTPITVMAVRSLLFLMESKISCQVSLSKMNFIIIIFSLLLKRQLVLCLPLF